MSVRSVRRRFSQVFGLLASFQIVSVGSAFTAEIDWTVRNRFPFLRYEEDFKELEAAHMRAGASGRDGFIGVLEAEHRLSKGVEGANWAAKLTSGGKGRVCFDQTLRNGYGNLVARCDLHFTGEKPYTTTYVNPVSHLVEFRLAGDRDELEGARCEWTFDARGVAPFTGACGDAFSRRIPRKVDRPDGSRVAVATGVRVRISREGAEDRFVETEVAVRDLLIVGMGDSIASGEGNPDRPVELSWKGFCFGRYAAGEGGRFYRPSRAGTAEAGIPRSCPARGDPVPDREVWDGMGADWLWRRCHRSMFGYQMRSAMAVAIRNRHVSVTYVPLGCSGAEIREGVLDTQDAREKPSSNKRDGGYVESQKSALTGLLNLASKRNRVRDVDAVLLSIGANDVGFSGLVTDVLMVPDTTERKLMKSRIVDPAAAETAIRGKLAEHFPELRTFLHTVVGPDLSKVIYTGYPNPALRGYDATGQAVACGSGRQGVDVHPAFAVDGAKLAATSLFVETVFLPAIETLATCRVVPGSPVSPNCRDPATQAMTFVRDHRARFVGRGFCATAADDPVFDRRCFLANGESFAKDLEAPLRCARTHAEYEALGGFRTYAERRRWVRSPNDAYFAAMTYPYLGGGGAFPKLLFDPVDLHDPFWGILTAVYGGAIHPTAEGHAAIAEAVLPELERVLNLDP